MRSILSTLLALLLLAPAGALADTARELVVMLAPVPGDDARATAARASVAARLEALGLEVLASLGEGLPLASDAARAARPGASGLDPARVLRLAARDPAAADAALAALVDAPGIAWAERNQAREPAGAGVFPDDPYLVEGRQWALENRGPVSGFGGIAGADIGARAAWTITTGSADVLLAVADTGIDPAHPEFVAWLPDGRPRLEPGLNVTLEPGGAVTDSFGHGTPVAGVMAARTNDGAHFDSLGIAGVCGGDGAANPGCRLLPIKIAPGHSGVSSSYEIARAMLFAAGCGARAMNLSFAGGVPSKVERLALQDALVSGCVVVAAAGNRGYAAPTAPQYPAAFAADGLCIQVGSSDPSDRRSIFSSYGPGLDLLAPGEDIWTTFMTYPSAAGVLYNGYVVAAGTSFAAPHVTGVVGLLAAARPELMDTDFQHVLRESAHDLDPPGWDAPTAWGRLDAAAALRAVDPAVGVWHGEAAAATVTATGRGTLTLGDARAGERLRVWTGTEELEASATVTLPDSFLPPVRVWPRVGGTSTARGGFTLPYLTPWAEVASADDASFTLRGHLYHVPPDSGVANGDYLPVPPGEARFGFTVMGRVDRPPSVRVLSPLPGAPLRMGDTLEVAWQASDPDTVTGVTLALVADDGVETPIAALPGDARGIDFPAPCAAAGPARLRVTAIDGHGRQADRTTLEVPVVLLPGGCAGGPMSRAAAFGAAPNPFGPRTWISVPWPGTLRVVDLAGRVVMRRVIPAGSPGVRWDGHDDRGGRLPAGLYFARLEGAPGRLDLRLVRLE